MNGLQKSIYLLVIAFIFGVCISSCEKEPVDQDINPDGEKRENTIVTPDFLDILNAHSLVVIDDPGKKSTLGNGNQQCNMYKYGQNGESSAVGFLDQDGNPIDSIVWYGSDGSYTINYPTLQVSTINRLNEDYLLIEGIFNYLDLSDSQNPTERFLESILLRESDGAIFDFGDKINWMTSSRYWNKYLYSDNEGSIYYSTSTNNVTKLATHPDGSVTREEVFPFSQTFKFFFVDGEGNIFYQPDDMGGTFWGYKVKMANAGIIEFDFETIYETDTTQVNEHTGHEWIWVAEDKTVHAHIEVDSSYVFDEFEWNNETTRDVISELSIDNSTVNYTDILDIKDKFENFEWHIDFYAYRSNYGEDEIILMYGNVGTDYATKVWGFDVKAGTYRSTTIPVNEGQYISAFMEDSDEYIYVAVDSKIIRLSKEDFTYIDYLPENQYDIFAFSVSDDGSMIFNALRYSDAKVVLGEIDVDGNITYLEEDMESSVTSLIRLN